MVFAPKIQDEGSIPQAPSVVPGKGELIGNTLTMGANILEGFTDTGSTSTSEAALHRQARENLSMEFERARQLEQQGHTERANAIIQQASTKYIASWARDEDFEEISATWGAMAPSLDFVDPQTIALQQAVQDEDFPAAVALARAENPDATDAELTQSAMNQLNLIKATNLQVEHAKARWTRQGEFAYHSKIDQFVETNIGALTEKERQGGTVTPEDLVRLETAFASLNAQLSRPANISDAQWKSIQDRKTNLQQLITTLKETPERIFEQVRSTELAELARVVTDQVDGPAAGIILSNPESIAPMVEGVIRKRLTVAANISQSDYSDIKYFGPGEDSTGNESADQLWPEGITNKISESNTIEDTRNSFNLLDGIEPTQLIQGSDEFKHHVDGAFSTAVRRLHDFEGRVSATSLKKMFGPKTVGIIAEMSKADPTRAGNMTARGMKALQSQYTKHLTYMQAVTQDSPWEVDVQTGEVSFNLDALDIPDRMKERIKTVADNSFGGDITQYAQRPEFYDMISTTQGPAAGEFTRFEEVRQTMDALGFIRGMVEKLSKNLRANYNQESTGGGEQSEATNPLVSDKVTRLLDTIASVESRGNYNAYYGEADNQEIDFTNMTISEVREWQDNFVNEQDSPSSAVGKYQIIRKTMDSLIRDMGLTGDEKFDEEMQDRMAVELLRRRGYEQYVEGKISEDQFLLNLAKEWASLPVPGKGTSYYAGDSLNKALISEDEIRNVL